jgi:DNA-binding LacI/PurR family transcriptional regulator
VLNDAEDLIPIGQETKERVLAAVRDLGYHPNQHARSLRGQRTQLIAMMIADISNPFYHPMVRAVQDVAHQYQCDVMVTNSDHVRQNEYLFCESIIRRPVDGVILVPYHLGEEEIDRLIAGTGVAVAVLGQHIHHPQVDTVYASDDQATLEAIRWLIHQRGHQRIGFIGVSGHYAVVQRRYLAYQQALCEAGLLAGPVEEGDWSYESGGQAMRRLLALPQRPTALFACNDLMALGAMAAAKEAGLTIPDELAVVGFDDIAPASWVCPQLTTVAQYPTEIGRLLATALFERIDGEAQGPTRRYEVPCRFIVRQSA